MPLIMVLKVRMVGKCAGKGRKHRLFAKHIFGRGGAAYFADNQCESLP